MAEAHFHLPVMREKVLHFLITRPDGIYVDCTVGGGGHALAILQVLSSKGLLVGLDADAEALAHAERVLADFPNKILRHTFYDNLEAVLHELGLVPVQGVFFDLGISSFQIDVERRGFSFQKEAPLDMRFDQSIGKTAADVVNEYPEEELGRVIREYGEERHWKAIVQEILRKRQIMRIETTTDLVEIVRTVVGESFLNKSLARVFQALRIEVNRELERLQRALQQAYEVLRPGGRIVVLAYHSLEDRIVKEFFKHKAASCVCPPELPVCRCEKVQEMKILTRKVVTPDEAEVARNPRARSARLRAAERIVPNNGDKYATEG